MTGNVCHISAQTTVVVNVLNYNNKIESWWEARGCFIKTLKHVTFVVAQSENFLSDSWKFTLTNKFERSFLPRWQKLLKRFQFRTSKTIRAKTLEIELWRWTLSFNPAETNEAFAVKFQIKFSFNSIYRQFLTLVTVEITFNILNNSISQSRHVGNIKRKVSSVLKSFRMKIQIQKQQNLP